ncbi:MAG TPA: MoaD/ThiS family protein [Porticoccaceae bacterium]|nr:MoaD/ThiS family protein [Porticoccaceae bacterium]HIG66260.1 MoaD/ThiS family protein [Porticoccaceae bacterium]HIK80787.1 MoaD/ThiS family protein [Porticoccaceae bacterium]
MINLFFFGCLGDLAKDAPTCIANLEPDATPQGIRQMMKADHPELFKALSEPQVLVSVNKMIVKWDQPLFEGDELAFLPPVTGG